MIPPSHHSTAHSATFITRPTLLTIDNAMSCQYLLLTQFSIPMFLSFYMIALVMEQQVCLFEKLISLYFAIVYQCLLTTTIELMADRMSDLNSKIIGFWKNYNFIFSRYVRQGCTDRNIWEIHFLVVYEVTSLIMIFVFCWVAPMALQRVFFFRSSSVVLQDVEW